MSFRMRHSVVVCEARPGHGEAVADELVESGYDVRRCAGEEALIEAVSFRHPSAVVYELRHQLPVDLAILALLRRVLPDVPLVLLTLGDAAQIMREMKAIHPAIVRHEPVGRERLHAAVRDAVRRARVRARRLAQTA